MASKDLPRATRKKKNDHAVHDRLAEKKARRRERKQAFREALKKSRRRGSPPPSAD
jgi:hypothetical protein